MLEMRQNQELSKSITFKRREQWQLEQTKHVSQLRMTFVPLPVTSLLFQVGYWWKKHALVHAIVNFEVLSVGCLCKLEHICMFKDGISENLMKYVGRFYDDSCCLHVILFQSKPREVSQYIALKTVISSFITINIYRTYGVKSIFLNLFSIFRFMKVMKRY